MTFGSHRYMWKFTHHFICFVLFSVSLDFCFFFFLLLFFLVCTCHHAVMIFAGLALQWCRPYCLLKVTPHLLTFHNLWYSSSSQFLSVSLFLCTLRISFSSMCCQNRYFKLELRWTVELLSCDTICRTNVNALHFSHSFYCFTMHINNIYLIFSMFCLFSHLYIRFVGKGIFGKVGMYFVIGDHAFTIVYSHLLVL